MIINYRQRESDMLIHQLYIASKSERIKKRRLIGRLIVPSFYLVLAAWYYYQDKPGLSVMILFLTLGWYYLYPIWEKKRYISHYSVVINEHFHARFEKPATLEFKEGAIIAKDDGIESYILAGEVSEIVELPQIILIKIVTGEALVIPLADIENIDNLKRYLQTLASNLKIHYTNESQWVWK